MSASPEVMQSLMEKIRNLPSERVAEIVDFVERLRDKLAKQGDIGVVKPAFEIPVLPVKKPVLPVKKNVTNPLPVVGGVAFEIASVALTGVAYGVYKSFNETDLSFSREGMYDDDGR
ncbi:MULTISPECIES: hypothetical protein [Thiothrix]|uniref:DUF2281 domain-containing protein n=2 Tax=Thiothrix TaxID=1030 RepID=A0AA51MMP7_9GAMM|nr:MULTISPECIES: hypothetical protein [Thiothrix]MBO0614544.1 hypothetical protein [Thiothrix fructosivorans]MDQ5770911.1 hypothetical protein [Thiothrix subterranea]QTX09376.1 hypothetical protein J1836_012105 [Thiothrix fructosivorans]WML86745.1 hypothetical protein RCG00_20990 [Thiothrix subterranea]